MRTEKELVEATAEHVRTAMLDGESAHDWGHVERVWRNAAALQENEGGSRLIVDLAALLHDLADHKFHGGDEEAGPAAARRWLGGLGADEAVISAVASIVKQVSFKGQAEKETAVSLEHAIVQDADRLDALGAIGIARTFAFGGHLNRSIFDPAAPPRLNMRAAEYKSSAGPTLNHFFEKLLLLKDRMLTAGGRRMAEERHGRMLAYLNGFFDEWFHGQTPAEWKALLVEQGAGGGEATSK